MDLTQGPGASLQLNQDENLHQKLSKNADSCSHPLWVWLVRLWWGLRSALLSPDDWVRFGNTQLEQKLWVHREEQETHILLVYLVSGHMSVHYESVFLLSSLLHLILSWPIIPAELLKIQTRNEVPVSGFKPLQSELSLPTLGLPLLAEVC